MSRSLSLAGLVDMDRSTEGEYYKAPSECIEHAVARTLFAEYMASSTYDIKHQRFKSRPYRRTEALTMGFDCNLFFDSFIGEIARDIGEGSLHWYTRGFMLDELVHEFYFLGYNNFHLDLTSLEGLDTIANNFRIFRHQLVGEENGPLVATYHAHLQKFGCFSQHCDLTLIGSTGIAAEWCIDAVFRFENDPNVYSRGSKRCVFHIKSTDSLLTQQRWLPQESRFYVNAPESLSRKERRALRRKGFAKKGNSLLIPDGHGDWKEVVQR